MKHTLFKVKKNTQEIQFRNTAVFFIAQQTVALLVI